MHPIFPLTSVFVARVITLSARTVKEEPFLPGFPSSCHSYYCTNTVTHSHPDPHSHTPTHARQVGYIVSPSLRSRSGLERPLSARNLS